MSANGQQYKYSKYRMTNLRQLGMKRSIEDMDGLSKNMYSAMGMDKCEQEEYCTEWSAVSNLEFSKDGKLLVVACQENAMLLYDSFNQKFIFRMEDVHSKCVNCIKYIDNRTFASGSDDGTVKLWDLRNLRKSKQTFTGHTNWVKSIDYSEQDNMLISSSLDGIVMGLNIDKPNTSRKLIFMNDLMRTKLSPDSTKMVIATRSGFIILVHDLDLDKLEGDFNAFRPNLYRLMQMSEEIFPDATMYNHLFSQDRKRNRFEFISDFPGQTTIISSIQIHPKGWCVLSRCLSQKDKEWTTVHDIQTKDKDDYASAFMYVQDEPTSNTTDDPNTMAAGCSRNHQGYNNRQSPGNPTGLIDCPLFRPRNSKTSRKTSKSKKIIMNLPRMTHFHDESNLGKGFIKEPCFSADGRVMCSPHGDGVRLFSFNDQVQEFNLCMPKSPEKLHTLNPMRDDFHDDIVLCSKFNPINNYQLVTGCMGGRIVWCAPNF